MVELVRVGRTPAELAREFEPAAHTIRTWMKQADVDEGPEGGETMEEKEEIQRLSREVSQLKMEREIPKKATAWFARKTESGPPKRSGS